MGTKTCGGGAGRQLLAASDSGSRLRCAPAWRHRALGAGGMGWCGGCWLNEKRNVMCHLEHQWNDGPQNIRTPRTCMCDLSWKKMSLFLQM